MNILIEVSKKAILLVLMFLMVNSTIIAQSFVWAKRMGGPQDNTGRSITVDKIGNVYTTGYFWGTVDFNPNWWGQNFLTAEGASDIYIQKLTAGGNLIWAKNIGGAHQDKGYCITVDDFGNIYVTGLFGNTVDFDPGLGVSNLTAVGESDIFILKLDSMGNFLWAKSMGGALVDSGASIALDSLGNVYVTGSFSGTVDFNSTGTANVVTAFGGYWDTDIFILKLDANGNFNWVKTIGKYGIDRGVSMKIDNFGGIYITGSFAGTVDFDPNAGIFNLTALSQTDPYILKLDLNGNLIWAKSLEGTDYEYGISLDLDNFSNVYVAGYYWGTVDFNPDTIGSYYSTPAGHVDAFVLKLDSVGDFIWVRTIGGNSEDRASAITVDIQGNVYTTGGFEGLVDLNPNAGVNNILSQGPIGNKDVFLQKLDANGNFLWAKSVGGPSQDRSQSIVTDSLGSIYITGGFIGTSDFDPNAGISNLIASSGSDIFILKLGPCAAGSSTDTITACSPFTWIDGNVYTADNMVARHSIVNSEGCDSFVTLHLTIVPVDTSVTEVDPRIIANAAGASFQWLDCDNNYARISGETTSVFNALTNGNYAVEVTENGCTDTSRCIPILSVHITKVHPLFKEVSIYPNPTSDGLVTIDLGELKGVSIKIFTTNSQLVYDEENIYTPTHQFLFDERSGVYFVQISTLEETQYYKLVKE